jgi:hypothetical protein
LVREGLYKRNEGRCLSGMNRKAIFMGAGVVAVVGLVCLVASDLGRGGGRKPGDGWTFEYTMPVSKGSVTMQTNAVSKTNGAAQVK